MRLFNQTSAECTNLFTVLHAVEPPETRAFLFDRVLPFELEVLQAKLKYWAGDHMGYLDALAALLHRCKSKARSAKTDPAAAAMWRERGARVCLIIASQLIEMKVRTFTFQGIYPHEKSRSRLVVRPVVWPSVGMVCTSAFWAGEIRSKGRGLRLAHRTPLDPLLACP